jgi:hypothetical protein
VCRRVTIFSLPSGELLHILPRFPQPVSCMTWVNDTLLVVSAGLMMHTWLVTADQLSQGPALDRTDTEHCGCADKLSAAPNSVYLAAATSSAVSSHCMCVQAKHMVRRGE